MPWYASQPLTGESTRRRAGPAWPDRL